MMKLDDLLGRMLIALIIAISIGVIGHSWYQSYQYKNQPPRVYREGPLYDQPIYRMPSKYQGINW